MNSNIGRYYVNLPDFDSPCSCHRSAVGIHGGSPDDGTALRCNQGIYITYGCVRMLNGCQHCSQYDSLNELGDWVLWVKGDRGHQVWIHAP